MMRTRPEGYRDPVMSEKPLRIGEVAERAATTVRTVRYYEEVGLLPGSADRRAGEHRSYTEADVERLREILQLKELLNLSLEQLRDLVDAEEARAALRERYHSATEAAEREELLDEAAAHLDRQLALIRDRRDALDELASRLTDRRERVIEHLAELRPAPARH
jgi:DNA-binding transcriptional MerR regulator